MIVNLIKPSGTAYNITAACEKVTWSGATSAPCRQASFDYLNAPYDPALKLPAVATGDFVSLVDEVEDEVFYGEIFGAEKSSQMGTKTFTAYDFMKNLLESKGQYNFKNVTPEAIAAQVCADAQIPIRYLYPTGVNIASMLCDKMNLHDIIMAGYTKAFLMTGKKYFPMIYKRGFAVYHKKWGVEGFELSDKTNIYESNITETVTDLKNVIKVYDAAGNQLGEQRIDESVKKYGVFQDIYTVEDGVDPSIASYNMLNVFPKQTIKVSAIGDINCISNYSVVLKDGATGISGRYWITSDNHVWEKGKHTMDLELTFNNLMITAESSKEKEATT